MALFLRPAAGRAGGRRLRGPAALADAVEEARGAVLHWPAEPGRPGPLAWPGQPRKHKAIAL